MKLTVADRLNIIYGLFPEKGSLKEMALKDEINDKIKFSSEEIEEIGLETLENGSVKWSDEFKDTSKDYALKPKEMVFLGEQVDRLDNDKAITSSLYGICKNIKDEV